jgi:hypothetical protein
MDKGCLSSIIGFIALVLIYGVLAKGDDSNGVDGIIKFVIFALCIVGVWVIVSAINKK